MEVIQSKRMSRRTRFGSLSQQCIAGAAIIGGATVIAGALLSWFSLFAGLQIYRGVDVLNGRLFIACGALTMLAGFWFFWHHTPRLRWGIGLLGFALLAFASWSLVQLIILHRQLSADPMIFPRLGPGLIVVVSGALLVFGTLFLGDERRDPINRIDELKPTDRSEISGTKLPARTGLRR